MSKKIPAIVITLLLGAIGGIANSPAIIAHPLWHQLLDLVFYALGGTGTLLVHSVLSPSPQVASVTTTVTAPAVDETTPAETPSARTKQ